MNAREFLGKIIWDTSRADESTISVTGANIVADAILEATRGGNGLALGSTVTLTGKVVGVSTLGVGDKLLPNGEHIVYLHLYLNGEPDPDRPHHAYVEAYSANDSDEQLTLRLVCPECQTVQGWCADTDANHANLELLAIAHNKENS